MSRGIQFFEKVNDIPLKYKFILVYVLCVLVPIVFFSMIFLSRISALVREREMENLRISIERARSDLVELVKGTVAVSHSVSTDRFLYSILNRRYAEATEFYDVYYTHLRDRINRYVPIFNHLSELSIYTSNNTITSGGNYLVLSDQVKKKEWFKDFTLSAEKIGLYAYRETIPGKVVNSDHRLCVIRMMESYESPAGFEHFVKINIDINRVFEIFSRERNYINICLLDQKNRLIYAPSNDFLKGMDRDIPRFVTATDVWEERIVFDYELGEARYLSGWRLVGIADKRVVNAALRQSRAFIIGLALGSVFLATFMVFVIVRSFNYRVKKLSKHMEKIENQQFDLIEINEGKDEIGGLVRSFNLMATKINALINDVYKLNMQKKDLEIERIQAELNFLQSQINPHFLFNTLNAIMVVCVRNNYTKVIAVLKYFSKTLRRLISWKEDLVTVKEELAFSEMYLKIEKFRFGEKFEYQILADQAVLPCRIPKMTIQPLIENACKHGIQTIKGLGVIKVKIRFQGGRLRVSVKDNGKGITRERVDRILQNLADNGKVSENIGICNVYRRLRLYYGEEAKFTISSRVNTGTEVSLDIPLKKRTQTTKVREGVNS